MIRNKNKFQVDLIITADWHLMEKERNPPCRLDLIWDAQWDKIEQIMELQENYKCPIYNAGDLFDYWKSSPELINTFLEFLEPMSYMAMDCLAGNHDLPQHNFKLKYKSGYETLTSVGSINNSNTFSYNNYWECPKEELVYQEFAYGDYEEGVIADNDGNVTFYGPRTRKVLMTHMMVWQGEEPWPGCEDPEANKMFKLFPDADLIITGHNHKTFTAKKGKQLLINPGSLTRHKADQINHRPCVFLWEAKTNTFKIHYLKIKKDVISREHIEIVRHKEERAIAFIEKLKDNWDIGLSFEDNMEKALQENKIPKKIKEIIYNWMEI